MSFEKRLLSLYIFFISLLLVIKSQQIVTVFPNDNNVTEYCDNYVYNFEFKVSFSQNFDKVIPFEMTVPLPNRMSFKCVLDGPNKKISCFHSFFNYVWSLTENSRVELPYSFPNIDGIRWDYDSFLRKIYRYLWRTQKDCGFLFSLEEDEDTEVQTPKPVIRNEIVGNVEEILDGECHSSKYDYSFNMKMKLKEGIIVEELKNAKNSNKTMTISFLHNIYVPILLGEKNQKGATTFRKDYEYKYALCQYEPGITQENFDQKEGLFFDCHMPISKYVRFRGPLQIKPFSDYAYITKTDKDGKVTTKRIGIDFNIPSSSKIEDDDDEENEKKPTPVRLTSSIKPKIEKKDDTKRKPILEAAPFQLIEEKNMINEVTKTNNNLRNLEDNIKSTIKEPNFLILDSDLSVFICPDKPILSIKNYDDGITFGGINTSGSKYLFLLYGYLSNGYDFSNDTLTLLDMTKDEIKFYLKITDNLEPPDYKKKSVKCTIPSGTSINKNVLVEVRCIGSRAKLGNNNTDLLLNWNLEENNAFQNIIVRWPYDLTKKKHIFFYDINGLSVKKEDYGCFENKFYFYLYVYDLKAEPKISFNIPLIYPANTEAVCRLYNSVTFKCVIDLRLKRLSKGGRVILPYNMTKYLANKQQNIVLYKVSSNNSLSSPIDFILTVPEDCGDFMLIGALKDIGYTYLQVIIIIICIAAGIALIVFGITFCVIYEITHRNRKGGFYRYTEEKTLPNTSVSQTKP
jgi:hypothetical protein